MDDLTNILDDGRSAYDLDDELEGELAAVTAERDRLEAERKEWAAALQSLTPSGSEFQTPGACLEHVRDRLRRRDEQLKDGIRERRVLAAENAGLRTKAETYLLVNDPEDEIVQAARRDLEAALASPSPLTQAVERVLEIYAPALGLLIAFKYYCEHQKDDCCNDPGAECPIAMGEWWEREEVGVFERALEAHKALRALLGGKGEVSL